MEKLIEYALFIVKSICKYEDEVSITTSIEDDINIINVNVSEKDIGGVIGKSGKNASSIRTLITLYAHIHDLGKVKINFQAN